MVHGMKIHDVVILSKYIDKYQILSRFSANLPPELELFLFQKGDLLLKAGKQSELIYFLVEGKIKIYNYSLDGKIAYLSLLEPFQIIGEIGSLWGGEATANAEAVSKVYCIGIQLSKYREFLLDDIVFLRFLCQKMALRIISINKYFSLTIFDSVEKRLASVIINNLRDNIFRPNLEEWAELLCTTYRHLLRTLNKFCVKGIIVKQGLKYVVLDLETLRKMAHYESDE